MACSDVARTAGRAGRRHNPTSLVGACGMIVHRRDPLRPHRYVWLAIIRHRERSRACVFADCEKYSDSGGRAPFACLAPCLRLSPLTLPHATSLTRQPNKASGIYCFSDARPQLVAQARLRAATSETAQVGAHKRRVEVEHHKGRNRAAAAGRAVLGGECHLAEERDPANDKAVRHDARRARE